MISKGYFLLGSNNSETITEYSTINASKQYNFFLSSILLLLDYQSRKVIKLSEATPDSKTSDCLLYGTIWFVLFSFSNIIARFIARGTVKTTVMLTFIAKGKKQSHIYALASYSQ